MPEDLRIWRIVEKDDLKELKKIKTKFRRTN